MVTMAAVLTLAACGVSVENEPDVEPAGDPGPDAVSTTDSAVVTAAGPSSDGEPSDDEQTDGEPEEETGSGPDGVAATADTGDAETAIGAEAVPVLYAGPAAGAPEVEALGAMIQTPAESCLALYRDAVPEGAYLQHEPSVYNDEGTLGLRCSLEAQSGSVLFTGEVSIMPDQRDDQEVVVEAGGEEVLQRGHLRSEIYVINDDYPDNHLATITNALDRVGTSTIEPYAEQPPPAELADDLPTSYTQPGRNTEEIIRLYRLVKDPYAGCQQLLAGALPDGARIEDDPMTQDSSSELTLWCTVKAPGGLAFVAAKSVVHPQTDTAVTEALAAKDVGWQDGFVLMTVELSGAEIDPAELLPAMHANLRSDF